MFLSPGETVADPPYIPEDKLKDAYLESLAHPIGMPRLSEMAHKGSTVTFVVPDRVKGGEQATSHRKLSIRYILDELYGAGVEKKDILFIISTACIPEAPRRTPRRSSARSFLTSSGIPARSSATTARIRITW